MARKGRPAGLLPCPSRSSLSGTTAGGCFLIIRSSRNPMTHRAVRAMSRFTSCRAVF